MSDTWYWRGFDNGKAESRAEIAALRDKALAYDELIYAVATKHPNETRHQTALRYIMQRESQQAHGPDKALRGEEK